MGKKYIIMAVIALFFGSISVVGADYWLKSNVKTVVKEVEADPGNPVPVTPERTIVVAGQALSYGMTITEENMREVAWAADDMPTGAFETIKDMLEQGERSALGAIELGEPVLASRITGPGARPSLSTLLSPGMRAVAIEIDVIAGVSGFIVPEDRVDVMLVQRIPTNTENGVDVAEITAAFPKSRSVNSEDNAVVMTSQVLANVKVLSVDQVASDRQSGPIVAGSATLELTPTQAALVSSAQNAGRLSLHLRKAGEDPAALIAGFGEHGIDFHQTTAFRPTTTEPRKTSTSVRVRLGEETQTHEVKIEGLGQ